MNSKVVIQEDGYEPVECDIPLPCPFCGSKPKLAQLAHRYGKKYCIIASTRTLRADTFWFKCRKCGTTTGRHEGNAQSAVENWNKRV